MRGSLRLLAVGALALPAAAAALTVPAGADTAVPAPAPAAVAAPTPGFAGEQQQISTTLTGAQASEVISRPDANYLKVHASALDLKAGDVLSVAGADGAEQRSYTQGDLLPDGLWALSVDGDSVSVSITAADGGAPDPASTATLDKVTRGFSDTELRERRDVKPYSVCGDGTDFKDTVCYESEAPEQFGNTPAVGRLLLSGGGFCTAWRIGAENQVMTNNHCIGSESEIAGAEVQFGYECATCGGGDEGEGTKVAGEEFLKTSSGLDATLFSVKDFDSISEFGFLELDNRLPDVGEEMYIIGHPDAMPKQLSMADDTSDNGNCIVNEVKTGGVGEIPESDIGYQCDTMGGSSGSPVLSKDTNKVIALHHLGGCPNQGARADLIAEEFGLA
ncbi:serine protease [Amycolatopsis antarctica]|uniref:Serine protease n=1 Tax=Amycolatopsis antarctica TaxID=1854586 RepID=A0A263CZ71_9PSEU|nr:serine protease [Amycolatopsis antarctica]OZM71462.1 serine protease [Amycolatopsis antarctica]